MATKYGKIRYLDKRIKMLNGAEVQSKHLLIEVEEQFKYDGFYFNVHRGRLDKKKWGVTESTTGLSVSSKKNPKVTNDHLHESKAEAIKVAMANLENAKKEKGVSSVGFFVFKSRSNQTDTSLFVELKKFKLK